MPCPGARHHDKQPATANRHNQASHRPPPNPCPPTRVRRLLLHVITAEDEELVAVEGQLVAAARGWRVLAGLGPQGRPLELLQVKGPDCEGVGGWNRDVWGSGPGGGEQMAWQVFLVSECGKAGQAKQARQTGVDSSNCALSMARWAASTYRRCSIWFPCRSRRTLQ